jgi:hypothetical protein
MTEKKSIRVIEDAKYTFSEEEKREMSMLVAQRTIDIADVESEKKAVVSAFKERADKAQHEARMLSVKIKDGYELRPTECEMVYDFEVGKVFVFRCDTGELVRSRNVTDTERQLTIEDALPQA